MIGPLFNLFIEKMLMTINYGCDLAMLYGLSDRYTDPIASFAFH